MMNSKTMRRDFAKLLGSGDEGPGDLTTRRRIRHGVAIFTFVLIWVGSTKLPAISQDATTRRSMISLDGTWQIAEGGFDTIPAQFDRHLPVPGLVDLAR